MTTLTHYFRLATARQASDIYFGVGAPPTLRVNGALVQLVEFLPLSPEAVAELMQEVWSPDQAEALQAGQDLVGMQVMEGGGRLRVLCCRGTLGYGLACRVLPDDIPTLASLRLPRVLQRIVAGEPGLVLVIGPAASGKTTTLAALVDHLNQHYPRSILTLEQPVEFIHRGKRSLIRQTLVPDTCGAEPLLTPEILKGLDVLVLDGLSGKRTMSLGLTAASRGGLVLAALEAHGGTAETLYACLEYIPKEERLFWRALLASHLRAVIWQHLLPGTEAAGRRPVVEVLINDRVISGFLGQPGAMQLIRPTMAAGRAKGMQTMRQALLAMAQEAEVSPDGIATLAQAMVPHYLHPVAEPF
jgi:twitching motility protein PilT